MTINYDIMRDGLYLEEIKQGIKVRGMERNKKKMIFKALIQEIMGVELANVTVAGVLDTKGTLK